MPPTTQPPPKAPLDRGDSAIAYLESRGIVSHTPQYIRSGDFEASLDEFTFYLTRRLRLVQWLKWSPAMNHGSWFHRCSEHDDLTSETPRIGPGFDLLLDTRINELSEVCHQIGIRGEARQEILTNERQEALTARAWYLGSAEAVISQKMGTWRDYLRRPYWRILGTEIVVWRSNTGLPDRGVLDRLLYHTEQNALWIVDYKTTSDPALVRLNSCPIEFQTQHYLSIVQTLLDTGVIQKAYSLPPDVKLAGMIHIAVETPGIRMSGDDRPFKLVDFTPTRGKNKGITRQEKEFYGEPQFDNYLRRVRAWYVGSDQYTHLAQSRESTPVCNISRTPVEVALGPDGQYDYEQRRRRIIDLSTRNPAPRNFHRSANSTRSYGQDSPWAPFIVSNSVAQWPAIIREGKFTIQPPDPPLDRAQAAPVTPFPKVHQEAPAPMADRP